MRVGAFILGAFCHLLVSGFLIAVAFATAMMAFTTNAFVGMSKMFIFFLKLWNLPVCLFDFLATESPKKDYWVSLSFSNPGPIHLILFWGWVIAFGCLVAFWRSRNVGQ